METETQEQVVDTPTQEPQDSSNDSNEIVIVDDMPAQPVDDSTKKDNSAENNNEDQFDPRSQRVEFDTPEQQAKFNDVYKQMKQSDARNQMLLEMLQKQQDQLDSMSSRFEKTDNAQAEKVLMERLERAQGSSLLAAKDRRALQRREEVRRADAMHGLLTRAAQHATRGIHTLEGSLF